MASQRTHDDAAEAARTSAQAETNTRDAANQAEQQSAQSSHVSPAMRIYRHALESICAMLDLQDLIQILAVSRSWAAAVRSMKPIGATVERRPDRLGRLPPTFRMLPPVSAIIDSPMLRHLAVVHIRDENGCATPLTNESLALLAQHAPHLTSLWVDLTLTSDGPLIFSAGLTSLELCLSGEPSAADVNFLLTTLATLPALHSLAFVVSDKQAKGVNFRLLGSAPSLTSLTLEYVEGGHPELSDEQVEQIRSSLGHLHRISVAEMTSANLERFLQPPVTARWQELDYVDADERTGDLLVTLPTLTRLYCGCSEIMPHADFLAKLLPLTALTLYSTTGLEATFHVPAEAVLASLSACNGLTELDVDCGFSCAHVSTLLAKLTKLRKLKLRGTLESLQCFASGPATQTLEELELYMLGSLPLSELPQLFALKSLRRLLFWRCFTACLDAATIDSLSPPCATFPLLTQLEVYWRCADGRWESVDRSARSFE